jgi:hypothetical protein
MGLAVVIWDHRRKIEKRTEPSGICKKIIYIIFIIVEMKYFVIIINQIIYTIFIIVEIKQFTIINQIVYIIFIIVKTKHFIIFIRENINIVLHY